VTRFLIVLVCVLAIVALVVLPVHGSDFAFPVDVVVRGCDGATPINGAYVEIQFNNGQRWNFRTDNTGEVHEIVVPRSFSLWRVGVDGLWYEWTSSTWADERFNMCWVHLPAIYKI